MRNSKKSVFEENRLVELWHFCSREVVKKLADGEDQIQRRNINSIKEYS